MRPDGFQPTAATHPDVFIVHAKQIGTCTTACGQLAITWHKYWVPFDRMPVSARCVHCIDAIRSDRVASSTDADKGSWA